MDKVNAMLSFAFSVAAKNQYSSCRSSSARGVRAVRADHLVNADAGQPQAVDERKDAEHPDFGQHLAERCAHALDADEAVDTVAAGEQLPEVEQPVGNALAGVRHAAEHQQRYRRPQQQQQRIFA